MRKVKKNTEVPAALAHVEGMNVKALLRKRGVYLKQRQNQELKEAAIPVAKELVLKIKKSKAKKKTVVEVVPPQKYISFTDDVVETYKSKAIHDAEVVESHFEKAIQNYLTNTLLKTVLDNLSATVNASKSKTDIKTKDLFADETKDYLLNQATIQLEPYLQNMAVIAGQDAFKLIDINDPYIPSDALRKLINGNVHKFSESMIDTDQQHLADIIIEGITDGKGVPEISSAIKGDFADYSKMQATRITRTEVLRSANQSAVDAFKQSGVVQGKQWVIAGADDGCKDFDGEVVTLEGGFYKGENEFQDGDPPLHPNCKCIVIPVIEKSD